MACPQCGTEIGEGAKSCATCGWKASKKTLWIVLGCVAGFFLLVCCGIGTFAFLKMKKAVQGMQGDIVPIQLTVLHAQVSNYAQKKGKAPATLDEASAEPILSKSGERVHNDFENTARSGDAWGHPYRFVSRPDRTFEIRSAGPDGQYDNGDDVVEKGALDDDVPNLMMEAEAKKKKMAEGIAKSFGVDAEKIRMEQEKRNAPPVPAPVTEPAGGTQGGGGK